MAEAKSSASQLAKHWDSAYETRGAANVSWFQAVPSLSIELIERLGTAKDAPIIDVGGGASFLVDELVERGFSDLSVVDVSSAALHAVRERLGPEALVTLIHEDLLEWQPHRRFDLWHDRAVFHFIVDQPGRKRYLTTLHQALRSGGSIVIGTFAPDGPDHCSGLPVARYSAEELSEVLGGEFEVVERLREEHVTPTGVTQPFTWLAARFCQPDTDVTS